VYSDNLKHWRQIRDLTLVEAAKLIGGIDPNRDSLTEAERSVSAVTQRAIAEAVERANAFAWTHAQQIDQLSHQRRKNKDKIAYLRMSPDIWEISECFEDFLPTLEMRASVAAVNADPVNVPILLPVDPWYTATVYGGELMTGLRVPGSRLPLNLLKARRWS
jgi:hypothetical protein